jgi:hypothetical protein
MTGPAFEENCASPRPAQTATSIILGSLAILIFGIQPLLYAAFVGEGLIEPDRLGLLSAAEVIAIAIGSSLAIPALKHASVRAIAGLAILLVAAANYYQTLHGSADMLFVFRMVAGLGSGFLVGIAGMAIAATSRVGQWAAAYLLAQATSQFLHLQWFALFWPAPTSKELLLSLAIASAAMLAGLPFLPRRLGAGPAPATEMGTDQGTGRPDAMGIRWLAVMFLFVGGVLTIWAYAGVWLESENVSAPAAATILSSSLAGQAVGAFAACLIPSSRHDRLRLTGTTLLLLLSAGAWFAWPGSAIAAAGFGIWWLSSVPVLSSILSDADPRRAALPFAPAAQLAGIAIIPTIAGFLLAARDVELVLVSGCAAIASGLLLGFARRPRRIIAWLKERRRRAGADQ